MCCIPVVVYYTVLEPGEPCLQYDTKGIPVGGGYPILTKPLRMTEHKYYEAVPIDPGAFGELKK